MPAGRVMVLLYPFATRMLQPARGHSHAVEVAKLKGNTSPRDPWGAGAPWGSQHRSAPQRMPPALPFGQENWGVKPGVELDLLPGWWVHLPEAPGLGCIRASSPNFNNLYKNIYVFSLHSSRAHAQVPFLLLEPRVSNLTSWL